VTITATNADGNASSTSFTFTVTDVAPSVAVTSAPASIAETGTAVAGGTFADYDDAVTITARRGASASRQPERHVSWSQSGLDEGSYTVTITATNLTCATASTSFTFTVADVARACGDQRVDEHRGDRYGRRERHVRRLRRCGDDHRLAGQHQPVVQPDCDQLHVPLWLAADCVTVPL